MSSYASPGNFLALNKLRGFTPRQQRLLELEAVYLGTQYRGLPEWEQEIGLKADPLTGFIGPVPLCGHEKEPRLKAGVLEEKIGKLVELCVGEGRFPTIKTTGSGAKRLQEALKQARLQETSRGPCRDLLVKGSGPLAFSILADGRVEAVPLRPEWCEPIFVSKVGRPRAGDLAEELALLGVPLTPARSPREFLWTPDGAASDDLAMLRYEYVYHEEAAVQDGGASSVDAMWRSRVDYLPTATVYYQDVRVWSDTAQAGEWVTDYIVPHGYGVVPIAWARSLDAEPGEPEGPSFITESLRSISEAADRALTRKDASVSVVANPKAYTVDLQDIVADYNATQGLPSNWQATSSEVLSFKAINGSSAAKIGLLEPTGKGPEVAKAHLDDLMAHAQRVSGVIAHDPQTAAGILSGTALERMMEPTIARVNNYRVALGNLFTSFAQKLAFAMGLGVVEVEVQWPPVVTKTSADQQAVAQALSTATGGAAVLSQATATKIAANAFEVEDPEAEVEAVTADAEAAMQQARDMISQAPPPLPADAATGDGPKAPAA